MSSRKSTRNSKFTGNVAESPTEPYEAPEAVGKKIRARVASGSSNIPTRKSERTKSLVGTALYNFPDSDESPPPIRVTRVKGTSTLERKRSTRVRKADTEERENEQPEDNVAVQASSSNSRPSRSKREKVQDVQKAASEDREPPTRKSSRVSIQTNRFLNDDASTWTINRRTPNKVATTPENVAAEAEASRKTARTRKAETPVATPTSAKVSRRKGAVAVSSTDTPETPRSSRRVNTAQKKDSSKETPVKPKASSSAAASQSKESKSSPPVIHGKKLEWKFNVYGIPKCPLPCRETQFEEIWKFLFENVTEKNSGCMYVSGVPGTGKTVIVQAVIDTMKNVSDKEKKNLQFKYLYINGLTLASPDKIWKRMFKGLGLHSKSTAISTKEALKRLDSHFESHQRLPVILVVDELDQILDKQQSILYQLLEWSSHARNMFSFVAIFNTMSLPEHGLAMRNYSRMGFKRAVFPPYSYEQLQTIVSNMLSTFKTTKLSAESVTLLSRKVAAISGDARRALEIARRALEIAEAGNLSGIQAVSNAFKEIFSSAKIETIKYTSLLEQMILKTICDEVRCSGIEEVLTAKIYENVIPKAVYEGMQWPKDEILKALMRLAIMHLVIVEDNVPSLHKRVLLKVPVEDVNFALGIHNDLDN